MRVTTSKPIVHSNDHEWNHFFGQVLKIYSSHKITKEQALTSKLHYYWNPNPCDKGHVGFRKAKTDKCRLCDQVELSNKKGTASYSKVRQQIVNRQRDREIENIGKDYYNFDLED